MNAGPFHAIWTSLSLVTWIKLKSWADYILIKWPNLVKNNIKIFLFSNKAQNKNKNQKKKLSFYYSNNKSMLSIWLLLWLAMVMLVGRRCGCGCGCGCGCVVAGDSGWQWLGVLELVWWFTDDGEFGWGCVVVGESIDFGLVFGFCYDVL